MKIRVQIIFLILNISFQGCKKADANSLNGITLIGFEPIKTIIDKENPKLKWYYKTKLLFKNDSVFIEKSPVSIFKSDTLYSVSEGGFYKYKGTWKDTEQFEIKVIETSCDYCPELVEKIDDGTYKRVMRRENYKGSKTVNGLRLNGIIYKK